MVGYVMVIYDYDIPEYDIWHMMIDASKQERGYGSEALRLVLEYIKTKPFGDSNRVTLTCNKDNQVALKVYHKAGFVETGAKNANARRHLLCCNYIGIDSDCRKWDSIFGWLLYRTDCQLCRFPVSVGMDCNPRLFYFCHLRICSHVGLSNCYQRKHYCKTA